MGVAHVGRLSQLKVNFEGIIEEKKSEMIIKFIFYVAYFLLYLDMRICCHFIGIFM